MLRDKKGLKGAQIPKADEESTSVALFRCSLHKLIYLWPLLLSKKKNSSMHFFSPDVVVKLFLLLQLLGWLLLQLLLHATPLAAAPNFYNFHPFSANLIITKVFQKALWKLRRPRKIENALFPLRLNSSKNGKLSPWKSANSTEFVENNFPYNLLEKNIFPMKSYF